MLSDPITHPEMRSWGLSGPAAAAAHPGALGQVSAATREYGLAEREPSPDAIERTGTAEVSLGQALCRARDLAQAFGDAPTQTNRDQLLHALASLARMNPTKDVGYDDILAIKALRRAMQAFARVPEHAEIVWSGCVVARFAEMIRDEPVAVAADKEYSRAAGVRWKTHSDAYFGPAEARATYDVLRAAGIVPPPGASLRFVSAAANSATHEAAMFERDHEISPDRKGGRQFIVGDIAQTIPGRALPGPTYHGTFLHVRWNAGQLPLAQGSVDVLWDRKGCTWYALMNDYQNPNQNLGRSPLMALAVLRNYEEVLKPGGSIVLDAIPAGLLPQVERSTPDAIELVSRESQIDVLGLIATRFDVRFVGEGVTRCLVLTKRLS